MGLPRAAAAPTDIEGRPQVEEGSRANEAVRLQREMEDIGV
jgi:hypothetical protein